VTYDNLLIEAETNGLIVKEKPLKAYRGRIKGNKIAIKQDLNTKEKTCVLAEELGHHYTSVGNILDQSKVENRKQERKARAWAYNLLIPLNAFVDAYKAGVTNRYELAEFLEVSEEFLQEAIDYYSSKYGICVKLDKHIIYFNPLGVMEIF